jgi:glycyl-tRNA synthetase (class II)
MSKVELSAYERYDVPREEDVLSILPNKRELGKLFKKEAKVVADALEAMCESEPRRLGARLAGGVSMSPVCYLQRCLQDACNACASRTHGQMSFLAARPPPPPPRHRAGHG